MFVGCRDIFITIIDTHGKAAIVANLMKMSLVAGARDDAFCGGGNLCLAQNASG